MALCKKIENLFFKNFYDLFFFINQQIQYWFATKLQYTSFMAVSWKKIVK